MLIKGSGLTLAAKKTVTDYLIEHIPLRGNVDGVLGLAGLVAADASVGDFATYPGAYSLVASGDRLYDTNGTIPVEWAGEGSVMASSFIWSMRFMIDTNTADTILAASYDSSNVIGERLVILADGRARWFSNYGTPNPLTRTGVLDDGVEHHILIYCDRTGTDERGIIVDGDAGTTTTAGLNEDTTSTLATFSLGGDVSGNPMSASSANYLYDVQLYKVVGGGLPANKAILFEWLRTHPNYPIPAELWS